MKRKVILEMYEKLNNEINELKKMISGINPLEIEEQKKIFTRKDLAKHLSVSQRYLQDGEEWKEIEHRVGGRIFYVADEVEIVIRNSENVKNV